MATYSFLDVHATFSGPGASINMGQGAAIADEGIEIEAAEDINTMNVASDGTPMHSLHGNKGGHVRVRCLKTSPLNQQLMQVFNLQTSSSALHGQNIITVANPVTNDNISCQAVAFKKAPTLTYAKEGGMNVWEFDAGVIYRTLGAAT